MQPKAQCRVPCKVSVGAYKPGAVVSRASCGAVSADMSSASDRPDSGEDHNR